MILTCYIGWVIKNVQCKMYKLSDLCAASITPQILILKRKYIKYTHLGICSVQTSLVALLPVRQDTCWHNRTRTSYYIKGNIRLRFNEKAVFGLEDILYSLAFLFFLYFLQSHLIGLQDKISTPNIFMCISSLYKSYCFSLISFDGTFIAFQIECYLQNVSFDIEVRLYFKCQKQQKIFFINTTQYLLFSTSASHDKG